MEAPLQEQRPYRFSDYIDKERPVRVDVSEQKESKTNVPVIKEITTPIETQPALNAEMIRIIGEMRTYVPENVYQRAEDVPESSEPDVKLEDSTLCLSQISLNIKIRDHNETPVEFLEMYVERSGKWYAIVASSKTEDECIKLMKDNLSDGVHCSVKFFDGYRVYLAEGEISRHEPTDNFYTYFVMKIQRMPLYIVKRRNCE